MIASFRLTGGHMKTGSITISLILAAVVACLTLAQDDSLAFDSGPASISGNLFAAAIISDSACILMGDRGKIFLSNDSAKTWRKVDSNTGSALVSVCFPDDKNGWAVGQGGVIIHTTDGGRTWTPQASGVDKDLLAVDFFDTDSGVAVGADSAVVMTADGGRTWNGSSFTIANEFEDDPDLAEEYNLFAVRMMDARQVCISGDGGRIFITRDAGQTWIDVKSPLYDEDMMTGRVLYSMAYDSGVLYAVGIDCTFVYSKDQGITWTIGDTGYTDPDLFSFDIVDGKGIAVGSGGNIIQTSDGGASWKMVQAPEKVTRSWLSGIDLRKDSSGNIIALVAGQDGAAGLFKDGSFNWH